MEAARRRFKVAFYRAADLVRTLTEARDERTLTLLHRRLRRVDVLILDELGFVPFKRAGGELLFDRFQKVKRHPRAGGPIDMARLLFTRVAGEREKGEPTTAKPAYSGLVLA